MPYRKGRQCRQIGGRSGKVKTLVTVRMLEQVVLTLDEFETLRICDLEGKKQIEAGEAMGVSRGTVQRLLVKARAKVVDALLNQKILVLVDGFNQEVPEIKEVQ